MFFMYVVVFVVACFVLFSLYSSFSTPWIREGSQNGRCASPGKESWRESDPEASSVIGTYYTYPSINC